MNFRETYPPAVWLRSGEVTITREPMPDEGERVDDGWLRIAGICSTSAFAGDGFEILPSAWSVAIPRYLERPIIANSHSLNVRDIVGRADRVELRGGDVYIEASISPSEPSIQSKVRDGLVTGFSIGFNPLVATLSDDGRRLLVSDMSWVETSIVALPLDPGARFSTVREGTEFSAALRGARDGHVLHRAASVMASYLQVNSDPAFAARTAAILHALR